MAKEYLTLIFNDDDSGRNKMAQEIDRLATQGWELKSKETASQGWNCTSTCCLGSLFLPLALLGRKKNKIHVILERERNPDSNSNSTGYSQTSSSTNHNIEAFDKLTSKILNSKRFSEYGWGTRIVLILFLIGLAIFLFTKSISILLSLACLSLIILRLINPQAFKKIVKRDFTKKQAILFTTILSILAGFLFLLGIALASDTSNQQNSKSTTIQSQ